MRIYSMTATFGKLEHETLTLQPGLNIIEAPNEWGKSTWCAFLVAMLYGIETRVHSTKTALADKERYAPWSGAPMSGRMDLCWNGRDITIERRSKGRSIFGIFQAYETASGLEVTELTADNCGQQLLGVEKSVFTRAGFLKLTDLPVTEDKALWRRLNALVTTGDESGAADALEQKLRDLKNRCRANRANGLIPQALAQQQELQSKLQQLQTLQTQAQRFTQRQKELAGYQAQLENHKAALEYAAAQENTRKAAAAAYHLEQAQSEVDQLQAACRALPSADSIYKNLSRLQQLRQQREALQMEAQMQSGAPTAPEAPVPFRGNTPEEAVKQASADTVLYKQLKATKKPASTWLFILGFCLTGTGLVFLALLPQIYAIALLAAGVVLTLAGLIYHNSAQRKYHQLQAKLQRLLDLYDPLPAEGWEEAAQQYLQEHRDYQQALQQYGQSLEHIKDAMNEVVCQLNDLTGGVSYLQWEQEQRTSLEQHNALASAIRQLRQAEAVHQALSQPDAMPLPPEKPDTLRFTLQETLFQLSEAASQQHQLQMNLGRCYGQMESLGQEAQLLQQLEKVNDRLEKLNFTYEALELAQQNLAEASAQLQRRFAPRIAKRAQQLLGRLTGSRYDRLTLGNDLSVMVGAQQEDTLHGSLWRSDGTIDQLYLALRLAVAEELTPQAPLVLDDALVRFDDTRLSAAMEILKEEAENKQVILFTCHNRESAHQ